MGRFQLGSATERGIDTNAPPTAVVRCAPDHRLLVVALGEGRKTVIVLIEERRAM
jgi:hypothetical protein